MTAAELIALADELAPNALSEGAKLGLVNEIESKIQMQIFLVQAKDIQSIQAEDADTEELCLPEARRSLYLAWMRSMIYWYQGEYELYENERAMFEAEWTACMRDECDAAHRGTG